MAIAAALLLMVAGEPQMVERFVRVKLAINSDARAADCTVVESDAPQPLQDKVCEIFVRGGKFTVSSTTIEQTVRFRLPADQWPKADGAGPVTGTPAEPDPAAQ